VALDFAQVLLHRIGAARETPKRQVPRGRARRPRDTIFEDLGRGLDDVFVASPSDVASSARPSFGSLGSEREAAAVSRPDPGVSRFFGARP